MREFQFAQTSFGFINDHFGLKKKQMNLLIGTTGTGKSTLARSILYDLTGKHRVMLCSSEECWTDLEDNLLLLGFDQGRLDNIVFVHEQAELKDVSTEHTNYSELFSILGRIFINKGCEIFFFDNITASKFYNGAMPQHQVTFQNKMRDFISDRNCPGFLVAHADAKTRDGQAMRITANDVRGSKNLSNTTEYIYTYEFWKLNTSKSKDPVAAFVTVEKCRNPLGNNRKKYLLEFSPHFKRYVADKPMSDETHNDIYEKLFKLGKK